jgi:hypothetical protein
MFEKKRKPIKRELGSQAGNAMITHHIPISKQNHADATTEKPLANSTNYFNKKHKKSRK